MTVQNSPIVFKWQEETKNMEYLFVGCCISSPVASVFKRYWYNRGQVFNSNGGKKWTFLIHVPFEGTELKKPRQWLEKEDQKEQVEILVSRWLELATMDRPSEEVCS